MKNFLFKTLAICIMVTMLVGCSQGATTSGEDSASAGDSQTNEDVIKIGVFEPLTGANAAGGEYEVRGIELAHSLYPTVLGKPVELVKVDNKSDVVEAAIAAARLVDEEKVSVVLGSWGSSFSMAGGSVFKESGTPAIGTSCTSPNVTLGNDYYFRVCFLEQFQGRMLATYAATKLNAKKCAIIYEITNDSTVGVRTPYKETFESYGGEIVLEASFSMGDQDFNSQLMAVMSAEPEVIFIPGNYAEVALCIKQARVLGYDVPFISVDTLDVPAFNEVGGTDVDGTVFSTFFDAESALNEETIKFVDAYKEKYNEAPSALTALGYDSYLAAIKSIEAAGSDDRQEIRDALAEITYDGATGTIAFDENGDAIKELVVLKIIKDGVSVFYDTSGGN